MVIMGRSRKYEPETCAGAVMAAIVSLGNRGTAQELFEQVAKTGHWTDDNIWQVLLSHSINVPAAYHKFPGVSADQKFLLQREDGNYELYNPQWHGLFDQGKRVVRG
jgi:hypothetical protein